MAGLEDRVFVTLARKVGYPSEAELKRCWKIQGEWAKDGNKVSLYDVAFAQGALTPDQFRRYERWSEQLAKAERAPLVEATTNASGATSERVIHDSAETFSPLFGKCERCGKELDDLGVVAGRVREVAGKRLCAACHPEAPSERAAPAPVPKKKKKNVVANVMLSSGELIVRAADLVRVRGMRGMLQSSAEQVRKLVRRKRPREGAPHASENERQLAMVLFCVLGALALLVPAGILLVQRPRPRSIDATPSDATPADATPRDDRTKPATRPKPTRPPRPISIPPAPISPDGVAPPASGAPASATPATGPPTPTTAATMQPEDDPSTPQSTDAPPPIPDPDLAKLNANADWAEARAGHDRAQELFRRGFAGSSAEDKQSLRQARSELERARAHLDKITGDLGRAAKIYDALSSEVNGLLLDVKKRQLATGSL